METLIITLAITFVLFLAAALLFNYSRKRSTQKGHDLTGMCHKSGGASCGCAAAAQKCADDL